MLRLIMPLVLIGVAITSFFVFTNPFYNDISSLRARVASYDEALNNSKTLENERDKLTEKYNAIKPDDLVKIKKLLPDNIDNIRLILEVGKIALPYGMILKNVKYNANDATGSGSVASQSPGIVQGGGVAGAPSAGNYGSLDLEFSTDGTYNNFINFLKDMESNLRIVDISSISFSSDAVQKSNSFTPDVYTYNFKIRTYWLKN